MAADAQTLSHNLATQIELARRKVKAAAAAASAANHVATAAAGSESGGHPPPPFAGIELHLEASHEVDAVLLRVQLFQDLSRGHTTDPGYARFRELVLKVAAILQRARCLLADPLSDTINAGDLADALELVTLSCLMMGRLSLATGGGIASLGEELWHWLSRQPGGAATLSDFAPRTGGHPTVRRLRVGCGSGVSYVSSPATAAAVNASWRWGRRFRRYE